MPEGLSDAEHVLWIRRHGYQYSYEAFQPPLYYALALPAWLAGDAAAGPVGALYAVRVFDALLAALLAPLSLLIALALMPDRAMSRGAALLTAILPGVALNLTSVTNDVLVSVLGAACILVAVGGRWSPRRVVLVGLLFGAALLSKTTAVGLAPALAVALLQRSRGGGLRSLIGGLAIAGALFVPWVVSNLAIYGEVITTREQLAMSAFPARTTSLDFWSVSTLHSFVTFWTGDPFLSLPGAVPLALLAAFITALALAGLVRRWRQQSIGIGRGLMLVVGLAAAGAGVVSVSSPVLAAFDAPGRLAYAGVCAVMALVAVGLWIETPSPRLLGATISAFAVLSLAGLALAAVPAAAEPAGTGSPVIRTQVPEQSGARAQPVLRARRIVRGGHDGRSVGRGSHPERRPRARRVVADGRGAAAGHAGVQVRLPALDRVADGIRPRPDLLGLALAGAGNPPARPGRRVPAPRRPRHRRVPDDRRPRRALVALLTSVPSLH